MGTSQNSGGAVGVKKPQILAIIGVLLLGANWCSPAKFVATTKLYFLPANSPTTREVRTDAFIEAIKGWSAPAELARSVMDEPEVADGVTRFLRKQKDPDAQKALESSYLLWENKLLDFSVQDPNRLEIRVSGSDSKLLRLYTSGLLDCLRTALKELVIQRRSSTQIEDGLTNSQEALHLAEETLARVVAAAPSSGRSTGVAISFGLEHYQEALSARLSWLQRRTQWQSTIEKMSPRFVVLSGPDIKTHSSTSSKLLIPLGLFFCLAGLSMQVFARPKQSQ